MRLVPAPIGSSHLSNGSTNVRTLVPISGYPQDCAAVPGGRLLGLAVEDLHPASAASPLEYARAGLELGIVLFRYSLTCPSDVLAALRTHVTRWAHFRLSYLADAPFSNIRVGISTP